MNEYNLIENKTGKVVGKIKIKKTIKEYALGAISDLTNQLETVRSSKKRSQIELRLSEWKKILEIAERQHQENLKALEEAKNVEPIQEKVS